MLKELLSGFFILFLCFSPALADEPVVMRLSTQFPPSGDLFQSMLHFKERVEAATKGAVRIDIYDTGKPFDSDKIAAAVSAGKVEMAQVPVHRFSEMVPVTEAYTMPFMFIDSEVERASRLPHSEIRTLIQEETLKKAGVRILWWIPEGSIVLLTKKAPVANPEAMAGKTVRAYGAIIAAMKHCGAEPREVPAADQQRAYESGQVDVGLSAIMGYMGRKLFHSMSTVTRTNQAILNDVVVINEKSWQALSLDQRAIFESAAAIVDKEAADLIVKVEANAYKQLVEKEGATVVSLTDQDVQLWRICTSDVLSDFMDKSGDAGQKLMRAYARLLQDPCCNHAREIVPRN